MPAVVLFIIVLLVAFLVLKSVRDARQSAATRPDDGEPARPQRSSRGERRAARDPAPSAPIDQEALTAHVTKLRGAVSEGLISSDEAVASIVRHTEGGLSEEAARKLLDIDEAA